jgi:capsular exopolysaccharide synthesis family protein
MQDLNKDFTVNGAPTQQDIDIKFIVAKIFGNWYWYILSIILFLALGVLIQLYTSPRYAVTARVLVNGYTGSGKGITGASETNYLSELGMFAVPNTVNNELEIIHSRKIIQKVVYDLQLNVTYLAQGTIRYEESYKNSPFFIKINRLLDMLPNPIEYDVRVLNANEVKFTDLETDSTFTLKWGDSISTYYGSWVLEKNPAVNETNPKHKLGMIITSYGGALSRYMSAIEAITTNEFVNIIDLEIDGPTPQRNEDILRRLLEVYVESDISERNRIADSTIAFINSRIGGVQGDLDNIDRGIEGFKKENQLTDLSEDAKLVLNTTADINKELATKEVQLKIISDLENYLADAKNSSRVMPTTAPIQDPAFVSTLEKYNALQLQRQSYLQNSTESNPLIRNLDMQLGQLRGDMLTMMRTFKNGVIVARNDLKGQSDAVMSRMAKVPTQERQFLDFTRRQNVMQELYLFLLQTREQAAVSKTNNISPVRVFDSPQRAPLPYFPNFILISIAAIFLGLVVPSVVIFMKELLNTKVLTTDDIIAATNVPIVSEIVHSKSDKQIIVSKDSRSEISEQFRTLRTNLQFLMPNPTEKVIMTTSSMSGEGKSFIAMNLANVLALSGKKVCLMEMDLRKPRISQALNMDNSIGFSNYIVSSDISVKDIVKQTNLHPDFYLIGSGTLPPNPAELLVHEKVTKLMAELKSQFDYVVIDCSPVGLVTDALLLGKFADIVLYVVRQRHTFKKQIGIIQSLYNDRKFRKLDIIFNDVKSIPGYGYGYGYGSNSYKYGYGYFEEDNRGFLQKLFGIGKRKKKSIAK